MPIKRGTPEDVYGVAPRDPRDTVKAWSSEPQPPVVITCPPDHHVHGGGTGSRWQNGAAIGTFRPVNGGLRGRSRGRTGHLRRARTSTDRESGIACRARAPWRRSPRSSPRAGEPPTWRRGVGDSVGPGA